MNYKDIIAVTENIRFVDGKIEEIEVIERQIGELEERIKELKKRLRIFPPRLESYQAIGRDLNLKLTFNQILDEIARKLKIERERDSIFVEFRDVFLDTVRSDTPLTREELIKRKTNRNKTATVSFKLATDSKNLSYNHGSYVSEDEVKEWEDNDPLYKNHKLDYNFEVKIYAVQGNGKSFLDCLETEVWREDAIRIGTSLVIGENYGDLYYYINPKNIDLDSDDYFAKAIKSLLTDDQLKQYSKVKKELDELKAKIEEDKKTTTQQIAELEEEIAALKAKIETLEAEIKIIDWPEITVRLGDFLEGIYSSSDNKLSPENTKTIVCEPTSEEDVRPHTEAPFRLILEAHGIKLILRILWTMRYTDTMYDGLSLYEHFVNNNSRQNINGYYPHKEKNYWEGLPKVENFCFKFDPKYFFRRAYNKSRFGFDEEKISIETIRQAIKYSMYREIRREATNQEPETVEPEQRVNNTNDGQNELIGENIPELIEKLAQLQSEIIAMNSGKLSNGNNGTSHQKQIKK